MSTYWIDYKIENNQDIEKIEEKFFFLEYDNKGEKIKIKQKNKSFFKDFVNQIKIEEKVNGKQQQYTVQEDTLTTGFEIKEKDITSINIEFKQGFYRCKTNNGNEISDDFYIRVSKFPNAKGIEILKKDSTPGEDIWYDSYQGYKIDEQDIFYKDKDSIFKNEEFLGLKMYGNNINCVNKTSINILIPQKEKRDTAPFDVAWTSNDNDYDLDHNKNFTIWITKTSIIKNEGENGETLTSKDGIKEEFKKGLLYFALQASGGWGSNGWISDTILTSETHHGGGAGGSGSFAIIAVKKFLFNSSDSVSINFNSGNIIVTEFINNRQNSQLTLTRGWESTEKGLVPESANLPKDRQYAIGGEGGTVSDNGINPTLFYIIIKSNGLKGNPGWAYENNMYTDYWYAPTILYSYEGADTNDWFKKYTGYKNFFFNNYPAHNMTLQMTEDFLYAVGTPSYCSKINSNPYDPKSGKYDVDTKGFGGGASGEVMDDGKSSHKQGSGITGAIFLLKTKTYGETE